MPNRDDKRKLRILKKAVKRAGNKHRRHSLKRQLQENPDEAHLAEEDLGGNASRNMNALDRPVDGTD
ncbi:MAG: hypothetical protein L0Y71_09710 [Gemmataceae bacterium]|nr:hypothetical protein [Gemmataceae bacterium]